MAAFYGSVIGKSGIEVHRLGYKRDGVTTRAAGWGGCVEVHAFQDETTGRDCASVWLKSWEYSGGPSVLVWSGPIDAQARQAFKEQKDADTAASIDEWLGEQAHQDIAA
jgi:hypothetical protein